MEAEMEDKVSEVFDIREARERINSLMQSDSEQVDEFNSGFDAYRKGVAYEDLHDGAHDQVGCGWAWAFLEDGRKAVKERDALMAEVKALKAGMAWLVECVIRDKGGTPDPEGWIAKAKEYGAARTTEKTDG